MPVHVFPPKSVLSHCSLNPASFGVCIVPSPHDFGFGPVQLLLSNLQSDLQLNVPPVNPNVKHVLPLRSKSSHSSLSWLAALSPHDGSGVFVQPTRLNVR